MSTSTSTGTLVHTNLEVSIDRPPDEVWAVVSDYETDTVWRRGITEMTPDIVGPPQVGTHIREVLQLAGKTYVTETEVTEVGPGLSYRFAGHGTSGKVQGGRRVRAGATPDSAVFTYEVEFEPSAVPRVARPVLVWWLRHSMRRDLTRLRDLIEHA